MDYAFYRLDVEALRKYGNILTKSHLTNVTGLNLEMIVKKFDKVNNVENDINALGWSGYLRDAALNMMGMSHHKPIDVHGIQENINRCIKVLSIIIFQQKV